jgi:hypothetical protein
MASRQGVSAAPSGRGRRETARTASHEKVRTRAPCVDEARRPGNAPKASSTMLCRRQHAMRCDGSTPLLSEGALYSARGRPLVCLLRAAPATTAGCPGKTPASRMAAGRGPSGETHGYCTGSSPRRPCFHHLQQLALSFLGGSDTPPPPRRDTRHPLLHLPCPIHPGLQSASSCPSPSPADEEDQHATPGYLRESRVYRHRHALQRYPLRLVVQQQSRTQVPWYSTVLSTRLGGTGTWLAQPAYLALTRNHHVYTNVLLSSLGIQYHRKALPNAVVAFRGLPSQVQIRPYHAAVQELPLQPPSLLSCCLEPAPTTALPASSRSQYSKTARWSRHGYPLGRRRPHACPHIALFRIKHDCIATSVRLCSLALFRYSTQTFQALNTRI